MVYKTGLLLVTLLVGSLALPMPEGDFFSDNISSRIVGGTVAAVGSHPHMVALTRGLLVRSAFCGASLISPRTVLTAAHCVTGVISGSTVNSQLRVVVGTNRWNSGGTEHRVSRGVIHPSYDASNIKSDIAILNTESAIALNNRVGTVTVSYNNVGGGVPVLAAGWGATRASGPVQSDLLEVRVTTLSGTQCENDMRRFQTTTNRRIPPIDSRVELCTFHSRGQGTCQGDSGSALRRIDNGQQVGIVSWGYPCAQGAPDVFVRVSSFETFIRANTM
ncbi:unnamed protein product [Arctia plantaginis]|uniref:Peptidase S1 domain-containing protein n=1 Tax=Arctia plantaginis TaxID=874455 RepID=A0A8S0ZBL0_ARCPL|nr:unnamed protein product [Arctia plantaginis]CAB3228227.1 unnamed protein product [Arctia plantaginis]